MNSPMEIKRLRVKANLTQKQAAEFFGMSLSNWQRKESITGRVVPITDSEFMLLQLLAGEHPEYVLCKRETLCS
ncbi:helix-turn-helix domain-containing protein (plasmid) [Edwardsiella tarda]|uniref:helix-turn-helix domain-containing protein n=1 Tax=Edwardsiella tarda TaxID=636 RepID=UPI000D512C66|nr:helix-turn-helix domain-containing protein [Edwardsiella tarda]UCQ29620.1 helix-turn-helix domain-containing protein [Edwardsiella tarda]